MSIKVGDLDLVKAVIDLEIQVSFLTMLLEWLTNNNQTIVRPQQLQVEELREKAFQTIQKKYPSLGIQKVK